MGKWLLIAFAACLMGTGMVELRAGEEFQWDKKNKKVSLAVENWPLDKLLGEVASKTQWKVQYEPGLEKVRVSATFSELSPNQALRRILGELNFTLVQSPSGKGELKVFRSSAVDATVAVQPAAPPQPDTPKSNVIPDELIVRVDPKSGVNIEELAEALGAKIVGRIGELNAYRLKFPDAESARAARAALEQEEGIDAVESNFNIPQPETPERAPTGPIPQSFNLKPGPVNQDGKIIIGLIDTAIETDGLGPEGDFLLPAIHLAGEPGAPGEIPSHGTLMNGTMMNALSMSLESSQDESGVRVLPIDVFGANEGTSSFLVAEAIPIAVNNGATMINLSLGGPDPNPLTQQAIDWAYAQGVGFFAAAGNDQTADPSYPAAYPHTLSVTAPNANYNPTVDLLVNDQSIYDFGEKIWLITGTSAATAKVTGMAAGMAESTGASIADIQESLRNSPLAVHEGE